jgi:hypothetical protein
MCTVLLPLVVNPIAVNKCIVSYHINGYKIFRGHLPVGVSRINTPCLINSNIRLQCLLPSCGRSTNTKLRPLTNISDCIPISYPSVFPVRSFYKQHICLTAEEPSVFNHVCLPHCSFRIYISHFQLPSSCLGIQQLKQNIFTVI